MTKKRGPYKPASVADCRHCGVEFKFYKSCTRGLYCSTQCRLDYTWLHITKPGIIAGTLSQHSIGSLRRFLNERDGRNCSCCKLDTWMGEPIPLDVDHIDGNHKNNAGANLRYLCPTCHAMQPTSFVNKGLKPRVTTR